ncbi:MAG: hypothetical protein HYS86_01745 [Candidatus Chisholmbacteria bacterium]|nr:hypothetical protein [Candidatus Chisholmbacteria bacterium]
MSALIPPVFVRVRDREKVIFEGQVTSITSVNRVGKFDVLSRHANFITLVGEKLILRTLEGREEEIKVETGVMRVQENKVQVYVGL